MKNVSIIILFTIVSIVGCSSSSDTVKEDDQNNSQEIYVFDDVAAEDTLISSTETNTADSSTVTDSTPQFIVQVGAFKTKEAAQKFVDSNRSKIDYEMQISYSTIVKLYVIQLPAFDNRMDAETVRNKLWTTNNFRDAFIITK